MKLMTGNSNLPLAKGIADYMNLPLTDASVRRFADNEIFVEIHENVRGEDMFVIQSTSHPANDNLMELLIMIDALRRASAKRITAVLPYFGYARQDRKDEGRVPITAKLVANLITRAGADRVLAMDLHAPQIQGFFDVPVDHLYAAPALTKYFQNQNLDPEDIVVVSPDEGSIKRAMGHSKRIGGKLAIVDKVRDNPLQTKQKNIIGGPVEGKICLMFDDMISTGGSICGAARLVHEAGAREIHLAATHGVLCGEAIARLREAPIKSLVITNTIPLPAEKRLENMHVLSVAPLLAEAIRRIHSNQSISSMFSIGGAVS
jgi:ribose-phosphate pyrophosphokinase